MRTYLKNLRVRYPYIGIYWKMFLTFSLVSAFLFLILAYYSLISSTQLIESQKKEELQNNVSNIENYFGLFLDKMINNLLLVSNDIRLMEGDNDSIINMLRTYKESSSSDIIQIVFWKKGDNILSTNQLFLDIMEQPDMRTNLLNGMNGVNMIQWSEPYYSPIAVDQTLAIYKPVEDMGGRRIGVMLIEVNLPKLMADISELALKGGQSMSVVTKDGKRLSSYVYAEDNELDKIKKIEKGDLKSAYDASYLSGDNDLLVVSKLNPMEWELQITYRKESLRGKVDEMKAGYVQTSLIYLLLLIPISFFVSRYFTRPIQLLARRMKSTTGDEIKISKQLKRKDEIGDLYQSYNIMLNQIQALIERREEDAKEKRNIEIKLLQSQIQPHFLGNTLACIRSLAREKKYKEIETVVRGLIILLNQSIEKTEELITISKELEIVEAYVHIQKIKYGETIDLQIAIPDTCVNYLIPKLLLQPLVENAIFHGLSSKQEGIIRITIEVKNQMIWIHVIDNGEGMDEERLRQLNGPSAAIQSNDPLKRQRGGIGVQNVKERIRLYFGPEYGLKVESAIGQGTSICIALPYFMNQESEPNG
ncbi:sensor histidine kinase [Paenibacillus ferrarius]|uniref:sensor histidine kinase n=1 Tax=Paenibacillus ferrarius TaxID=1469647 RepID=UPI003D26BADA